MRKRSEHIAYTCSMGYGNVGARHAYAYTYRGVMLREQRALCTRITVLHSTAKLGKQSRLKKYAFVYGKLN